MAAHKSIQVVVGVCLLVLCNLWLATTVVAQGEVSFIARRDFRVGGGPVSITLADFNGDGHTDLAVVASGVAILLGQGDGTFVRAPEVEVGGPVTVGDFNGDGHLDLATANLSLDPGIVSILLGRGDGTFQTAPVVEVGEFPVAVAVGDFNGDGHLDLAVVNEFGGTVSIRLGRGDGTFVLGSQVEVGGIPMSVAMGDFNGDGH